MATISSPIQKYRTVRITTVPSPNTDWNLNPRGRVGDVCFRTSTPGELLISPRPVPASGATTTASPAAATRPGWAGAFIRHRILDRDDPRRGPRTTATAL